MTDTPILHRFFSDMGLPDISPYPMKVMAFMNLHNIDYKLVSGDVRKAPLGKIPYLEHKGKQIPDSELILDYLEQEYQLPKDDLTAEQHAIGHSLCRTLDERLYWVVVYSRWIEDKNWPKIRDKIFSAVPTVLRGLISNKIRNDIRKTLYMHGIGRHAPEQMYDFARRDLQALSDLLADKPYLFGEQPSRYDCTAVSFVAGCLQTEMPSKVLEMTNSLPNLPAYWERGKARLFSSPG